MKKVMVGGRIPIEWHQEICEIMKSSGLSQTEIVNEAIGLYLGKVSIGQIPNRLDILERRVSNISAIVASRA